MVGMDALSLVFPEDRDTVPDEYEVRCTTKSGNVIWVKRRNADHRGLGDNGRRRPRDGTVQLKMLDDAQNSRPQNPLVDGSERGVDFVAVRSRLEARGGSARWSSRLGLVDVVTVVWPLQGV